MSHHLPRADGTAAGRALWALREGLRELGHAVEVHTWSFDPAPADLPAHVRWVSVPRGAVVPRRARALVRPRSDAARHPWEVDLAGAELLLADDPVSWSAVRRALRSGSAPRRAVATVHYSTRLDAEAVGRRTLGDVQDRRAERRLVREAPCVHAFSDRVARALAGPGDRDHVAAVPIAFAPGADPAPPVERPVAALLANWDWPPNRVAADLLLRAWPEVRDRVPGATLRLAGRGRLGVGTVAGVDVVGEVADSRAFLEQAAVVAFPCPTSSGPKVKVLEAAAAGLPVVTSPAGLEGFADAAVAGLDDPHGGRGAVVVDRRDPAAWAAALVDLLRRPERRAALGAAGRVAVVDAHAPARAAGRRLDLLG